MFGQERGHDHAHTVVIQPVLGSASPRIHERRKALDYPAIVSLDGTRRSMYAESWFRGRGAGVYHQCPRACQWGCSGIMRRMLSSHQRPAPTRCRPHGPAQRASQLSLLSGIASVCSRQTAMGTPQVSHWRMTHCGVSVYHWVRSSNVHNRQAIATPPCPVRHASFHQR